MADIVRRKGYDLGTDEPALGRYGNSPESSAALIRLITHGEKRATSSLVWGWEAEREMPPKAGDIEVILDWNDEPVAVIRFDEVFVLPFDQVTAEYAFLEAENDRSLESWRKSHWEFFQLECEKIGKSPTEAMPILCTRFHLLAILE
ncbi:MAG: ASCH domain-containing protein [Bacteroidota bacterium]|nr:ASCH domain-containing protein [Bacteroidota bacterium]